MGQAVVRFLKRGFESSRREDDYAFSHTQTNPDIDIHMKLILR